MTTRQKVAAKYVNVLDRVEEQPQRTLVPLVATIQRVGEDIDLALIQRRPSWFGGAMDEFDDRTLADFIGTGLQGE